MICRVLKSPFPMIEEDVTSICIEQHWKLITIVKDEYQFYHYFEVISSDKDKKGGE